MRSDVSTQRKPKNEATRIDITKRKQTRRSHEMPRLPRFWKISQSLQIKKQLKQLCLRPAFVRTKFHPCACCMRFKRNKIHNFLEFLCSHCKYMTRKLKFLQFSTLPDRAQSTNRPNTTHYVGIFMASKHSCWQLRGHFSSFNTLFFHTQANQQECCVFSPYLQYKTLACPAARAHA